MKRLFAILLAVLMLTAIAMPVFAGENTEETEEVVSPTEKKEYKIDVYYDLDQVVYDGQVLVTVGDDFTFTPKDQGAQYIFDHLEIEGDYTVTQNGNTFVIHPNGDLVIHVKYKGQNPPTPQTDDTPISPNTGLPTEWLVLIAVIAVAGVVLSVRKLRKN